MNFKKNIKERMCLYMIIHDKKIMFCSEKELEFVNAGLFDRHVHYHDDIRNYRNSRPATNIETVIVGIATIIIGVIITAVGLYGAHKKGLFAITD